MKGVSGPAPLAGQTPSSRAQALGRGQRLLPGLRREEAVPAGAKGVGQGLRASSRGTIPGPPPPSAGAAAGSYRLPTHPPLPFLCLSMSFFPLSLSICPFVSALTTLRLWPLLQVSTLPLGLCPMVL